ncbi:MAG: mannitol dehydrogenase family protein [Pseudonocardia sp.]|nr:mannitol dehydrogenase family protein [Pseudonocardia sp.]
MSTQRAAQRLTRSSGHVRPAAPVRIVHLGLGNFFRTHQAWYTDHAPDREDWGIAAFGGRGTEPARSLAAQDGLYTLITRGPGTPTFETITSVSAAHAATEHDRFRTLVATAAVAVVTLTVTEAGYRRAPDGTLDTADPAVAADLATLRADPQAPAATVPVRLAAGLAARRAAGAGPIAIVSCDNLAGNGPATRRVVLDAAELLDPALARWIDDQVTFPATMVDRITPRTTTDDLDQVRNDHHVDDPVPVVTEPFSEWVVADSFPAGRPRWEDAGARLVADVENHEARKLLMLNGSHSLLAYAGPLRGHTTVADAIADPVVRGWVEQWWDVAGRHVPVPDLGGYRDQLLDRFANPAMRHLLGQIAADGSEKLRVRTVPVLRTERRAGELPVGAVRVLAAWLLHLRGTDVADPARDALTAAARGELHAAAAGVLAVLDRDLAADAALVRAVAGEAGRLGT